MGANTKIEWAHHTFNPWEGCSKVSDGCKNCYAEERNKRFNSVVWGEHGTRRRTSESNWRKPHLWNRLAALKGERQRVFCASLADVFEDREELHKWREDLFRMIEATPHLDWLLLTKRPENINYLHRVAMGYDFGDHEGYPNVWIGTSVENQEQADARIPALLQIPAVVRFLSMEPLLGPVTFKPQISFDDTVQYAIQGRLNELYQPQMLNGIHWVIAGGESGPNARPMHLEWVRRIIDQCKNAHVPFLFKQWGEWLPFTTDGMFARSLRTEGGFPERRWDNEWTSFRVGKKEAGRTIDGRTWDEFPEALHA